MVLQMHCEVVRFFICLSLMGFATAKCFPERCGSMNLSYPFWIDKPDCGYPGFRIKCMQNSSGVFAPFLTAFVEDNNGDMNTDFEILDIDYTGSLIINSTSLKAMSCNRKDDAFVRFILPSDGPFTISSSNRFVVIGCNSVGSFTVENNGWGDGSCKSACQNQNDPNYCNGYGCCATGIPGNKRMVNFTGGGISYKDFPGLCGFSTIFDPLTWTMPQNQLGFFASGLYGLRINWSIGEWNCSTAMRTSNYSCAKEAECQNSGTGEGHLCKCRPGYEGNGYSNGTSCTDINECRHRDLNECVGQQEAGICENLAGSYTCSCLEGYRGDGFYNGTRCTDVNECSLPHLNQCVEEAEGGICKNLVGSYDCSCSKGYSGDGFQNGTKCTKSPNKDNSIVSTIIGSVSSFVAVSLGACALFWWLRRRRLKDLRDKNFRENGGLQLQDLIASMGGRKGLTIFSEKELDTASNNYSNVLGKGGFATVYKGVLLDHTAVAIKKPKAISEEFINEIMIFSYINHRNVVKLLGCCLETQYPLIVYEFVPNETLYEHLQSTQKHLSWETRRQIAIETADAIAYMHLQASQPIFHRDIKSSNILLDDTFTPKVADFGISRLRPSDEPHLSTMAAGTPGYLDPCFIRSNQFTDKSDVFSFGVVLVELLTGLKPLLSIEGTICTLYDHFMSTMNNNCVTEILDPSIVNEENRRQMENMARLASACLQVETKARPSMREVVEELAWIRAATKQSGLYRDASLVEQKPDSLQVKLSVGGSTSEDPYTWLDSNEIITSENPSTALIQIQMSDRYAR